MSYRVLVGDCIEQMRSLPDRSVDCVDKIADQSIFA